MIFFVPYNIFGASKNSPSTLSTPSHIFPIYFYIFYSIHLGTDFYKSLLAMKNELCTLFVVQLKRVCRWNIRSRIASIKIREKSQNCIPWYQQLSLFDNFQTFQSAILCFIPIKKIQKKILSTHDVPIAHDRATFKPMPSISKRGFVYLQSLTLFLADKATYTRARGQNASPLWLGGICDCHVFHDFSFNSHTSLTRLRNTSDECEWPQKATQKKMI